MMKEVTQKNKQENSGLIHRSENKFSNDYAWYLSD